MNPTEEQLFAKYKSLPTSYQRVLEVLSIHYQPLARTTLLNLVKKARIKSPKGRVFTPATWKLPVKRMLDQGLIKVVERQVACNSLVREMIARSADRGGRVSRYFKAVEDITYRSGYSYSNYGHYYFQVNDIFEDIRKTIYLNEPNEFQDLMQIFDLKFRNSHPSYNPIEEIVNKPFDADWLATKSSAIRERALNEIIPTAHLALMPADAAVRLLQRDGPYESGEDLRTKMLVKHYLLKGDIDRARKWLPCDETPESSCLGGWEACLRGDYKQSIELYEAAFRQIKKETRKRHILIPSDMGAFYVLALLATRDGDRIRAAQDYVELALKKQPASYLYQALNGAVQISAGKLDEAGKLTVDRAFAEEIPALHRLFVYTALRWVDERSARKHRAGITRLRQAADTGCYPWVAAQCDALLIRLGPSAQSLEPSQGGHASPGTVLLLDAIPDEQPWERRLAALERFSGHLRSGRKTTTSKSRLTWRIKLNGEDTQLEPYAQKRSRTGKWSKGRKVPLSRLHGETNRALVTGHDLRVCQAIVTEPLGNRGRVRYTLDVSKAVNEVVGHPHVFWKDDPSTRVEVVRSEPQLRLTTRRGTVRIQLVPSPPEKGNSVVASDSPTRVTVVTFDANHREIFEVVGREGVAAPVVSKHRIVKAVSSLSNLVPVHSDFDSGAADVTDVGADSTPLFHLTPYGDGLQLEPLVRPFGSEGPVYRTGEGGEVVFATINESRSRVRRDHEEETRRYKKAVAACRSLRAADWDGSSWTLPDPVACLELLDELRILGKRVVVAWPKGETMRIKHHVRSSSLALKIRQRRDWFGIDGEVQVDSGLVLGLSDLLQRMEQASGRFVALGDNEFLALSSQFRRRLEEIAAFADRHGKGLRFHRSRTHAMVALTEEAGSVDTDGHWDDRVRRFQKAQSLDPAVPSTLQAELRGYQAQGFRWAGRLAAWGAGACLADDMGLGKTVQALAVALERAPSGPTLVIAPTSVCPNWVDEARRFTPTLNALQFGPGNRAGMIARLQSFDVLICSYGLLRQEIDRLAGVKWETIVLDEAQAIKNRTTMTSRAAMRLKGKFRMITTGTPVENHLGELWNLFQFINPGLLGSMNSFAKRFATPIHQGGSDDAKSRLKRLIQPFILRRTKSAVLDELPARTEITIRVEMPSRERAVYEAIRQRAVTNLGGMEANRKGQLQILAELMKLRRACCHPNLVMPELGIQGSKLESFGYTVDDLLAGGHKALVFSQFVDHLKIVRSYLDERGIGYRYLDGSTPPRQRKREVDRFQAGDGDLFLISLRAGGHGLNLTAADYVLHLDPWWNPAVEDQASDRAHRIGQTRPVTIYRFVMKDTIEEKIVDLHASKRDLAENLLEGADISGKISADELLALLRGN